MTAPESRPDSLPLGMGADAPPSATVMDPPVAPQAITALNEVMASMGFPGAEPQDTWDYQQPAS